MKPKLKFVTKLFAAIDGYAEIKAWNEQQALTLSHVARDTIKPIIEQHNGVWMHEKNGEIFANFKLPEDAVNCAVAIQQELRDNSDVKLRIGIHTGDIKSGIGTGDIVASKIAGSASLSGICISGKVYASIQNTSDITAEYLEDVKPAGVEHPVSVYSLTVPGLPEPAAAATVNSKANNEKTKPSIAVLPFRDMSADKDQDYFCEGISEEIINALTHIEDLKVIARTSAFAFKGKQEDIREIGKKLDVENLLEGSIRKAGNRLRITAQLVKVADGSHLWSDAYNRELEDVFAIQEEISLAIVEALKVKLLNNEKVVIEKQPTEKVEAYNLYLLCRHHYNMGKWEIGLEYCKQAIEIDQNYAQAYAGIAEGYARLENFEEARAAAKRALQIDSNLAEGYTISAWLKLYYDWDFVKAEREFKKAIALNTGYSLAHQFYAKYLRLMGRFTDSINEIKIAKELDPLPLGHYAEAIAIYLLMGNYDEAQEQYCNSVELDPNNFYTNYHFARLYCKLGEFEKSISVYKKLQQIYGYKDSIESRLGYVFGLSGKTDEAQRILQELLKRPKDESVLSIHIALIYLGLGETDKAFEWLEKAYLARDINLLFIKVAPEYENIRSDPRYTVLLKKIGLYN